jgi:putative hydrolase of the HAD superfamily
MHSSLANLNQIDSWVFDLDNTLYPASASLFPQIDVRMREFIANALALDLDEAHVLQKRYYHDYGTTLRGLMIRHAIEPEEFLAYVHDIDHDVLEPAPRLANALATLPGRKMVYTNGSERHAVAVIARLGLAACFDGVFDIRAANYIPKPSVESYHRLIERHALTPGRTAMFEDIERNLAPAAKLGMTTIWVRDPTGSHWSGVPGDDLSHIDHITEDLAGWLESAAGTTAIPV